MMRQLKVVQISLHIIKKLLAHLLQFLMEKFARVFVFMRWVAKPQIFSPLKTKHTLTGQLIISLTSYPPRFSTLHFTLKCLLTQNMQPDMVILWVAYSDYPHLPRKVLDLQKYGLSIKLCEDLKSYKKIIPCLIEHPDAAIVIADDDVYYGRYWLQSFVSEVNLSLKEVICRRAHRINFNKKILEPLPYAEWEKDTDSSEASIGIFPTGVGGVLYRNDIFDQHVLDRDFINLCPQGDDIWLYWMALMNGAKFKKISSSAKIITWNGSQDNALWKDNIYNNGNDKQIRNMISHFGNVWKNYQSSEEA
jgi:protein O-GlcNAc transferase